MSERLAKKKQREIALKLASNKYGQRLNDMTKKLRAATRIRIGESGLVLFYSAVKKLKIDTTQFIRWKSSVTVMFHGQSNSKFRYPLHPMAKSLHLDMKQDIAEAIMAPGHIAFETLVEGDGAEHLVKIIQETSDLWNEYDEFIERVRETLETYRTVPQLLKEYPQFNTFFKKHKDKKRNAVLPFKKISRDILDAIDPKK